MNMKIAPFGRVSDFFGIEFIKPVLFNHIGDDIMPQTLQRKSHIGVFLHLPIQFSDILVNFFHCFFAYFARLSNSSPLLAVNDVGLGRVHQTLQYEHFFNNILHLLHGRYFVFFEPTIQNFHHSVGNLF